MYFGFSLALIIAALFPALSISLRDDLTLTRTELEILIKNLKWRRANNMDNILKENWSDFDQDFRSEFLGCDKEGSPVISIPIRDWNVRRAVMAGQSRKLMRYLDKQLEEVATLMREARQNGQNMTQFKRIMDMTNFDFRIQACPLCIPVFISHFLSYENHFPGSIKSVKIVNCPPIFVSLWKIVRDFLPPGMKDILMLYGKDKTEWKTALLKEIDASQLTKEFGGQNDEGFSMGDVIKCSSLSITQAKRNLN
ncbi:uncharacterized protein LOC110854679 isoform X2 [Folsomia candida]|uniref:uncharacterized protein LOC110854679 isoform X2 n=1 Tax=Folsomia candida TaxID=158441 RepID=UPI001604CC2C|nr:uncharacterized protein LOC110854679 isoform X2 [Folsomia candida]